MAAVVSADIFLFRDFRFDRRSGVLSQRDQRGLFVPLVIGRRALDVLGVLVERPGDLVSRDEIIGAVWPHTMVEDANLTVQISTLRRFLSNGGSNAGCIQTIPGRGYCFIGLVSQHDASSQRSPVPLPDKPSIAVLPFTNMSGDPEQEYFVDGMVEEIITALSHIGWLFVIARNSSFIYKGQAVDVKQVGRELGVRYLMEGSVRKHGNRVRITGQLIDAVSGEHLWADRFDGSLEDVFDLQDRVSSSVAGVIEPALQAAEATRSVTRRTADLTTYDLYLRAYAIALSSVSETPQALHLLDQAIARDPNYGPALALASFCCFRLLLDDRSEDRQADRRKGVEFARRALQVAGDEPGTLANAAFALAYFGEDIDAMIALVDRSLSINPSFARGWYISGILRNWAGQYDLAIERAEAALRLSPRARVGTPLLTIGAAHFMCRRFEEAVPKLLLTIQDDPSFPEPYRFLAACYAHMGRVDDAREVIKRLRGITNFVIPDARFFRKLDDRELLISGVGLAAALA